MSGLSEAESRRKKVARNDGITPHLGRNLPSVRVVWNYERHFLKWKVAERR